MKKVVITGANGHMGKVITSIIEKRDDCEIIAGIDLNRKMLAELAVSDKEAFAEIVEKAKAAL